MSHDIIEDNLSLQMIVIADRDKLAKDHEMRKLAKKLQETDLEDKPTLLLKRWARARRCYCDYTGEPLAS